MKPISRRAFFFSGAGCAAAAAAVPVLSEGFLAATALGPVPDNERSGMVWLHSNENPYGPCQRARDAIERATGMASRYPYDSQSRLVERIARLHNVSESQIVIGNGSSEVLRMASSAFLRPGKTLVAADLTYESPGRYASVTGAAVKTVPLTSDFRHDVKAMSAAAAAAGNTGLIYVCNPNNPTASITPKQDIAELVAALPSGAVLLIDEAYHHFSDSPAYESALKYVEQGKNVVVSRTFSKIYALAGLRIGYAIAPPQLTSQLRRHALHLNTNVLGLEAAAASLEDPDLVPRTRDLNSRARRLLTDYLDRNKIEYAPSQANFLFFRTGRNIGEMGSAMRQRGIAVGRAFPPMTDWMRVTIGTEAEMKKFLAAYQEIRG